MFLGTISLLVITCIDAQVPADRGDLSTESKPTETPGGALELGNEVFLRFPQQTRSLAGKEVIERGSALFKVHCAACHGNDLRGGDQGGPNLLRSEVTVEDQHGERIMPIVRGARSSRGMPSFALPDTDVVSIAEYIHSVLAKVGSQGRPPGSDKPVALNVIVGNRGAGGTYFRKNCAPCHSPSRDLKGIASKYPDPRVLQNAWVAGGLADSMFLGLATHSADVHPERPTTVTVTFIDGHVIKGPLIRLDDFLVTLTLVTGERLSIARNQDVRSVDVDDPREAHRAFAMRLSDKDMHDVTAYLSALR